MYPRNRFYRSFVFFQKLGIQIDENSLHEILNEVDLNKNGQVELDEFLQVQTFPLRTRHRFS